MGNIFDCAQNPLNVPTDDSEAAMTDAAGAPKALTIEGPTRLKDSVVWKLQKAFYEKMSVAAWSEAIVPNFVTSNRCVCFSLRLHNIIMARRCCCFM